MSPTLEELSTASASGTTLAGTGISQGRHDKTTPGIRFLGDAQGGKVALLAAEATSSKTVAGALTGGKLAAATAAAIAAGPSAIVPSASEVVAAGMMSGGLPAAALPRLELRGCTPIGPKSSRFEINLGQQIAHPSSLEWEVSLVRPAAQWVRRASHSSMLPGSGRVGGRGGADNWRGLERKVAGVGAGVGAGGAGKTPLDFRLYTLHTSDAEWLTLGHKDGQLKEAEVQASCACCFTGSFSYCQHFDCRENCFRPAWAREKARLKRNARAGGVLPPPSSASLDRPSVVSLDGGGGGGRQLRSVCWSSRPHVFSPQTMLTSGVFVDMFGLVG